MSKAGGAGGPGGSTYELITVPHEGKPTDTVCRKVKETLAGVAEVYKVELPGGLMVGTLDTLMSLSDELVRVDGMVENVVRKIEKQYADVAGRDAEPLRVGALAPDRYVRQLEWDFAKYAVRQPLPALVGTIQSTMGKIEEELRSLTGTYTEKTQAAQALKRKKQANLMTADLSEVLTEDKLRHITLVETDHLTTLIVAVNKNQESAWLDTYHQIGADIAAMGSPDWSAPANRAQLGSINGQHGPEFSQRTATKGSPVIPGSTVKIMEDGDACLYTVTVLKGQYQAGFFDGEQFQPGMQVDYVDAFKKAAKEKRFTAKDFKFDPERAGELEREANQLKLEAQQLHAGMLRWCKAHFGEAMIAWMHIKLIRGFVESVLRYGLPVDFSTLLVECAKGKEAAVTKALDGLYANVAALGPQHTPHKDDKEDKDEYHAFVANAFALLSV
eukprot:TRINITY_DN946_c0_g1_i3.p1 TRINITY_DN946_c0_g1~~TRINITY_DN946_c0_g1_i3.p1  ORF type:complete len:444 (-),score=205.05 TRINITY_DN946_c0_g1_i3:383-1714(-)